MTARVNPEILPPAAYARVRPWLRAARAAKQPLVLSTSLGQPPPESAGRIVPAALAAWRRLFERRPDLEAEFLRLYLESRDPVSAFAARLVGPRRVVLPGLGDAAPADGMGFWAALVSAVATVGTTYVQKRAADKAAKQARAEAAALERQAAEIARTASPAPLPERQREILMAAQGFPSIPAPSGGIPGWAIGAGVAAAGGLALWLAFGRRRA